MFASKTKQNYDENFNKNIFITYEITSNGKNDSGVQVTSGTYIYKIQAGIKFRQRR